MKVIGFRLVLAIFMAVPSGVLSAQNKNVPIRTTICELVKHPRRYNGRIVEVRATVQGGFETSALVDPACSERVWFDGPDERTNMRDIDGAVEYAEMKSPKDADHPNRLKWLPLPDPVSLQKDASYQQFADYLGKEYRPKDPRTICMSCPMFTVTATLTGRYDHASEDFRSYRDRSKKVLGVGPSGFGHLNGWASQFVLQSVRDVSAKPVKEY